MRWFKYQSDVVLLTRKTDELKRGRESDFDELACKRRHMLLVDQLLDAVCL